MLILTRRANERVLIADDIIVEIIEVNGGKVRLGVTAPPHIRVDREEVAEKRRREGNRNGDSA